MKSVLIAVIFFLIDGCLGGFDELGYKGIVVPYNDKRQEVGLPLLQDVALPDKWEHRQFLGVESFYVYHSFSSTRPSERGYYEGKFYVYSGMLVHWEADFYFSPCSKVNGVREELVALYKYWNGEPMVRFKTRMLGKGWHFLYRKSSKEEYREMTLSEAQTLFKQWELHHPHVNP